MIDNKEYLIELLFKKLNNNSSIKINLQKKELIQFIHSLINNNQ